MLDTIHIQADLPFSYFLISYILRSISWQEKQCDIKKFSYNLQYKLKRNQKSSHTSYLSFLVHHCIMQACRSTPKCESLRNKIAKIGQNFAYSMPKSTLLPAMTVVTNMSYAANMFVNKVFNLNVVSLSWLKTFYALPGMSILSILGIPVCNRQKHLPIKFGSK